MGDAHRITLDVDRSTLFDTIAKVGDGGEAVGQRLASILLGDDSMSTAIGLAVYGITIADTGKDPQ